MPMCPHCKNIISASKDIRVKRMSSADSNEVDLVCCAKCDAVLGVD